MDLGSFFGAFIGALIGGLLIVGVSIVQAVGRGTSDALEDQLPAGSRNGPRAPKAEYLPRYLLRDFRRLFPNWKIYGASTDQDETSGAPVGVQFRTAAGKIDFLCLDEDDNFVVVVLQQRLESEQVITQVDRYIAWVEAKLCRAGQDVRGLIIAAKIDRRLSAAIARRPSIDYWAFHWQVQFDHTLPDQIPSHEHDASDASLRPPVGDPVLSTTPSGQFEPSE